LSRGEQAHLDCVVVGGCGHVGLPLALALIDVGSSVGIFDSDTRMVALVRGGRMPFHERGAEELLVRGLQSGRLELSDQPEMVHRTELVITALGTPIDEFLNPSMRLFERLVDELAPHMREDALVILVGTVFPGATEYLSDCLRARGVEIQVAFCPERIAEGNALAEIRALPQIIGVTTDVAFERASAVFDKFGVEIIRTTPREAELAKLMTNAWRYMKFAIANEFFEIAHRRGLDYSRILDSVRTEYPRAADLPGPGLAAGPRLLKDTMQLAAFSPDQFPMGRAAMLVNEGLPGYIVDVLDGRKPLIGRVIGILGMAFKGESDDPRNSLSYKLKKLLGFKGAEVLCTDPYVRDPELLTLEQVVRQSDTVIVAAPHTIYREIALGGCDVVDIWGMRGDGIRL
jgi:UDP-N-acetyl-D-mannosaminuronic acid dehydrogenase